MIRAQNRSPATVAAKICSPVPRRRLQPFKPQEFGCKRQVMQRPNVETVPAEMCGAKVRAKIFDRNPVGYFGRAYAMRKGSTKRKADSNIEATFVKNT